MKKNFVSKTKISRFFPQVFSFLLTNFEAVEPARAAHQKLENVCS